MYLCDNIGLVLVSLPSRSTDVTPSPRQYMTLPSGIPILSPVLNNNIYMHVGDPYIPPFDLLVYNVHALTRTPDVASGKCSEGCLQTTMHLFCSRGLMILTLLCLYKPAQAGGMCRACN